MMSFGRLRIAPGGLVTFTVTLVAPPRPGIYEFWWNLERDGMVFHTPGAHVSLTVRG